MYRQTESRSDWLESWLAEGNDIEHSSYYLEKQEQPEEGSSPRRARRRSRRLNARIVNREHKLKVLRGFEVYYYSDGDCCVRHRCGRAPIFLRVGGRAQRKYGCTRDSDLESMLRLRGRIVPGDVYIYRTNNPWLCISNETKRYVKNRANRIVRRHSGDMSNGRYAHRVSSRQYTNILF